MCALSTWGQGTRNAQVWESTISILFLDQILKSVLYSVETAGHCTARLAQSAAAMKLGRAIQRGGLSAESILMLPRNLVSHKSPRQVLNSAE